jgi:signal transduction histidine kinase
MFKQIETDLKQFMPAFDMDKVIGQKIESFHRDPVFQQKFLDNMDSPITFEMRVGEQIIVVNALPVNNALKHRVGLVAEFENITERENNKAKLLSTIEQNQLLNHQVNQMQKVESLSRLTSGIAHDFNNILSAIIGYNQLNAFAVDDCQEEALKEEIAYNTHQVGIASERAANLIKKMMAYSRQNISHDDIDVKPTRDVVDEVLSLMRPALTSLFQFNADIESELTIQIDSTSLHQIITNLIVNARDAMPKGGHVSVSLKKVTTPELVCDACVQMFEGEFIELRVSDTGTGIAQKVIDHIFDPFFTTKEVGEGTGLGLSTVSGMVHEARGHIKVESKTTEPNQGTVFRLLFPLNELKK